MRFRPPLAHHPRLALLASVLIPLLSLGWVIPRITGESPRWPVVIATSLFIGLITYLARTRSARFLGYLMMGISVVALLVYGITTFAQGIPQDRTERIYWVIVIAIPVTGLALGWWMFQRPHENK